MFAWCMMRRKMSAAGSPTSARSGRRRRMRIRSSKVSRDAIALVLDLLDVQRLAEGLHPSP